MSKFQVSRCFRFALPAACGFAALLFGVQGASAVALIQNGSFESNAPPTGFYNTFAGNTLLNWTYVDGPRSFGDGGWEQSDSADGNLGFTPNTPDGSAHWVTIRDREQLYQTFGTVAANISYDITFDQGSQFNSNPGPVTVSLWDGIPGSGVLLSSHDFAPVSAVPPAVTTTPQSITLSTGTLGTNGHALYLLFQQNGDSNTGTLNDNVLLDNVVVNVSAVPEPAALSVLGLAGIAVLRRRR